MYETLDPTPDCQALLHLIEFPGKMSFGAIRESLTTVSERDCLGLQIPGSKRQDYCALSPALAQGEWLQNLTVATKSISSSQ